MKKVLLFIAGAMLATACQENGVYDEKAVQERENLANLANTFNFSTIQDVTLSIDYSAYDTHGPVFFSIYNEDPFEGSDESISLKEDVKPVFEGYTDAKGKFTDHLRLPAYVKTIYAVTGNFFVPEYLLTADVKNGSALLKAEGNSQAARKYFAAARHNRRAGELHTNNIETLYQLYEEVDVTTGNSTGKEIYKKWSTALGSWDTQSGRPDYLLDPQTANPNLIFTPEEKEGLYETVANALVANQTCREDYRIQADLTVEKASEIAVTFLGSMTCWNNSMGYYYYNESNKPKSIKDLNIIMLFPNTQDGKWWRDWMKHPNFYGNIALERGDAVQLFYYPNIANGDTETKESIFPAGTKIGFILKSNGWGMQKTQGDKKFFNSYNGLSRNKEAALSRQYNVWAASSDGMSYCNTTGLAPNDCKIQNPTGAARSAKFAYKNGNDEYAIVGFEDACNDLDYDDIVIALKPASAFTKLPVVEDKKTSSSGIYAFEDLWPSQGDYDMNDAMVEAVHEKNYSVTVGGSDYKIKQESFYLTTYQNYVTIKSGLGVTLDTKEAVSSIVVKKVSPKTGDTLVVNNVPDGNNYLLTEDITAEIGTTYILEVNYKNGFTKLANVATIKPFIYRAEGEGRWEVHIPFEAPTNKMITSYFGTLDDKSVPSEGKYYVRNSDYPFAFYLDGVSIDSFKDTMLNRIYEKTKISDLYPTFLNWVTTKGAEDADWYLHPFVRN